MSLAQTNQESMEGVSANTDGAVHRRRRMAPRHRKNTQQQEQPPQTKSDAWNVDNDSNTSAQKAQAAPETTIPTMDAEEKEEYQKIMADDEQDEIPVIPSLQDEAEERFQREVADAPDKVSTDVQGLGELDQQLFTLPTNKLDEHIDLSVLTSILSVPDQITEDDAPWNDHMFRNLLHETREQAHKDVSA